MIQGEPQRAGMVEKYQWKNHRKGDPERKLLIDGPVCPGVEKEKPGHSNGDGGRVVDIDRADEVSLLAFELEIAMAAVGEHVKRFGVKGPVTAPGAFEQHSTA
jgi:hypothetical protein